LLRLFTLFYAPLLTELLASLIVRQQVRVLGVVDERRGGGVGVDERGEAGGVT
jgi:hypothetical protein